MFDYLRKVNPQTFLHRIFRILWNTTRIFLFVPSPVYCFPWRRFLLRCFGAKMGKKSRVYPSTKIWAPWNLEMGDDSDLSWNTDCYSVAKISIGTRVRVSQYSFLCTGDHDIRDRNWKVVAKPIVLGDDVWIAADVFVASGIRIGDGAVVGARSSVFKDVKPWTVVAGSPAKFLKKRIFSK
jgi:putative colanic acid biosynthesis acetyltransferase WcaF